MAQQCIVGCKLPNGLILQLPGHDKPVTLKGANSSRVLGGYGTTSVDKEAFEKWLKDVGHKFDFVKNGSVFVVDNMKDARAVAKERRAERTGFEPLDPLKATVAPIGDDPKAAVRALEKQRAENPDRNRTIDELDVA